MIDNTPPFRYTVCKVLIKYVIKVCIFVFCIGVVGVTISLIEEHRMHRQIDEMNERTKQHGKMDTNH